MTKDQERYPKRKEYLKAKSVAHRKNRKLRLIAMFGGKCIICSYDRYAGALEFHHLHPDEKDFKLSEQYLGKNWELVVEEARKCLLVCSCCHKEIHAGLITCEMLDGRITVLRPAVNGYDASSNLACPAKFSPQWAG